MVAFWKEVAARVRLVFLICWLDYLSGCCFLGSSSFTSIMDEVLAST